MTPKINTNAKNLLFPVKLSLKDMHEPPALKHLLNKEIEAFQQHKLNLNILATIKLLKGIQNWFLKLQQQLLDSKIEMDLSERKYDQEN